MLTFPFSDIIVRSLPARVILLRSRIIPIPLRPYWNNKMTREAVRANENERFEKYLAIVYNAFPPSRLNHFEHNLDVWRQLWRVCELSDLLVLCADARHPLFHFPPSLYDFVVTKMRKRMVLVLNKIDLVPSAVLLRWQALLERRYPGLEVLLFSSYPLPGTVTLEDHDLRVRRRNVLGLDGRANVKRPAPVGVAEVLDTWRRYARELYPPADGADHTDHTDDDDDDANSAAHHPHYEDEDEDEDSEAEAEAEDSQAEADSEAEGDPEVAAAAAALRAAARDDDDAVAAAAASKDKKQQLHKQQLALDAQAQAKAKTAADTATPVAADDDEEEAREALLRFASTKVSKVRRADAVRGMKAHIVAAATQRARVGAERAYRAAAPGEVFTVGLVGHPNAGKSSIINALLGRTAVSVSNTPGHTKHLQTIARVTVEDDIQLCDCPGLVFPAADMPRPLQVLMGIFPLPQLREPYSCVEFLAERLLLVEAFALAPYTAPDSDCALSGALTPGRIPSFAPTAEAGRGALASGGARSVTSATAAAVADNSTASARGFLGEHCAVSGSEVFPQFLPGTLTSPLAGAGASGGKVAASRPGASKAGGGKAVKNKTKGRGGRGGHDDDDDGADGDGLIARLDRALAEDLTVAGSAGGHAARFVWSAYRVCEAYAARKGWCEDSGRPDTFRAGLDIIKDCLEGRLPLFFEAPPLADDD